MAGMNIDTPHSPWTCIKGKKAGLRLLDDKLRIHFLVWKCRGKSNDSWSNCALNFKYGNQAAIQRTAKLMRLALPLLLQKINPAHRPVGLITALPHGSTDMDTRRSLPIMAKYLAENIRKTKHPRYLVWVPYALKKEAHKEIKKLQVIERQATIHKKYRCMGLPVDVESIIILDDFVTTGATFSEIARAIWSHRDIPIHPVALGKNFDPKYDGYRDNRHIEDFLRQYR